MLGLLDRSHNVRSKRLLNVFLRHGIKDVKSDGVTIEGNIMADMFLILYTFRMRRDDRFPKQARPRASGSAG